MEKKEINELQALRDRIALSKPSDAKLYFVTRILREGMQRRKAIADKFLYKVSVHIYIRLQFVNLTKL